MGISKGDSTVAHADKARRDQLKQFQARQAFHAHQKSRATKDQWVWVVAAVTAVTVASLGLWAYGTIGPGKPQTVADPSVSENREWSGQLAFAETTLEITLDGVRAPQAVANFVDLNSEDYFDDSSCHRVTTQGLFVMQCGDPLGVGIGNPGYTFGPLENTPEDGVYPAGTLAMARAANDASSMGSQFFVVYQDSEIPDDSAGGYTVFGQVTSGLEEFIERYVEPGTADGSTDGQPAVPVFIDSITIR
jgi:peptidyl-prolyl cis-trans isomerase B (cyclophilin B)